MLSSSLSLAVGAAKLDFALWTATRDKIQKVIDRDPDGPPVPNDVELAPVDQSADALFCPREHDRDVLDSQKHWRYSEALIRLLDAVTAHSQTLRSQRVNDDRRYF
jgi:hypothetical protein